MTWADYFFKSTCFITGILKPNISTALIWDKRNVSWGVTTLFYFFFFVSIAPGAPLNITTFNLGPLEGILVNWTEIEDDEKHGIIIGHEITVSEISDDGNITHFRTEFQNDSSVLDYQIRNLSLGIKYLVCVAGKTSAGVGPQSPCSIQNIGILGNYSAYCCIYFVFYWPFAFSQKNLWYHYKSKLIYFAKMKFT